MERECNWPSVADRYVEFLKQVCGGSESPVPEREETVEPEHFVEAVEPEAVTSWVRPEGREYATQHTSRFIRTLEMTPAGDPSKAILEMGAYMQMTPALKYKLCYGTVRGCYFGPLGRTDHKVIVSENGEPFECDIDHFDAERDVYPYPGESFDTVLCCELIEHLFADPMHMMSEINRILKPGGHVVITTPNIGLTAIASGA